MLPGEYRGATTGHIVAGVGRLNADSEALRAHATLCDGLAADLVAGTAPACPSTFQATTASVAALQTSVATARSAMVNRMQSTAAAVHATAAGLDAHETTSATALRSLAE